MHDCQPTILLIFSQVKVGKTTPTSCDHRTDSATTTAGLLPGFLFYWGWQCILLSLSSLLQVSSPHFFFSYQMRGATSHWQCGNHTTQDKQWAVTTTNDCTVIIIVSPSTPPLPFPTQLTSHHHQTRTVATAMSPLPSHNQPWPQLIMITTTTWQHHALTTCFTIIVLLSFSRYHIRLSQQYYVEY